MKTWRGKCPKIGDERKKEKKNPHIETKTKLTQKWNSFRDFTEPI